MRLIVISLTLLTGEALAHSGHGLLEGHLHGWEYLLLAAVVGAVAFVATRR